MTTPPLCGLSILVVEGKSAEASDLRNSLIRLGANVHVVRNLQTALMVASRKRLHGAILDCIANGATQGLCTRLAIDGVPFVFHEVTQSADEAAIAMAGLVSTRSRGRSASHAQLAGSGNDRLQTSL